LDFKIRLVDQDDAASVLEIYTPFVLTTAASFETEVPSIASFKERLLQYSSKSPWVVAELNNRIIGYAYATAHRSRAAYQWTQETTVYVHPDFRKQGVALSLYRTLLKTLTEMGFTKALAVITIPNEPSIRFHEKLGFKHIGEMKNIGFKFNRWHTTSWWDLDLQVSDYIPQELKAIE
jgi:L-amino acid N-acyltransferase YncA